ncbi:MAG: acyltransferase family protein [Pseudomonadota bacterium]
MALEYRPDIDGLRAVAVLPVLAFHFDRPWAPGGFVGVDVFFVISGFLITSIIRRELDDGTFSLARFYERRIRRILPALFAMIAITMAAATILFLPTHFRDAAQSAVAAAFFASNILFWIEAGYFEAAAYTKPLLHTWSLAIEEQFYIFVPLILMALARFRRSAVLWIGVLTLASFALSALTTDRTPTSAYYLLPWRAWELGVGAMLALVTLPPLRAPVMRDLAALVGLGLIVSAIVTLDKTTVFPGVAALLPVLGASLVIYAGLAGPGRVGALLGAALPVWIGKRSYSLYLWHWPLVVGFAYTTMDLPGPLAAAGLFIASLILADLSYRFVETPFRQSPGTPSGRRRAFIGAGSATALLVALAMVPVLRDGLPGRLPAEAVTLAAFGEDRHAHARACERRQNRKDWSEPCLFGAESADPPSIVLLGDSHGPAFLPALDQAARSAGLSGEMLAHNGCPNFPDFQVFWAGEDHDCAPYVDATWDGILADPDVNLVVYTLRAQMYVHGWPDRGFAESRRSPLMIGSRTGPLPEDQDRTAFFLDRLETSVLALKNAGKQVMLVYPLPEAARHVPEAAARALIRGGDPLALSVPRNRYDARTAAIIEGYDRIVADHGLLALRSQDRLCDRDRCRLFLDGVPLYRDTNHLTETAARSLAPDIAQALGWLEASR